MVIRSFGISAVDEAMREKVINRLKEKVEVGINKEKNKFSGFKLLGENETFQLIFMSWLKLYRPVGIVYNVFKI